MTHSFTKLFSSITESTVWCEPDQTRICWITMLAMADRNGMVLGSIPGLANRARITLEAAEEALKTFMLPDKYSRSKTDEGRRIQEVDGGWRLINYDKYRALRDAESVRESKRRYINERRQKEREEAENAQKDVDENVDANVYCRAKQKQKQKQSKPLKPVNLKTFVQINDAFTAFWIAYPKKKAKADAQKAWKALAPDEALQATIASALEKARTQAEWEKDGGAYIPLPATWLRGRRWEDEIAQTQSTLSVDFDSIDYGQHIRAIS